MRISYVFMALIALGSGLLLLGLLGFRFNISSSLPPGVYRVVAEPATRGSVVHVCLPVEVAEFARRRGYLGPGSCAAGVRPLGKIVVAIEGDVVALSRDGIRVNGEAMPNSVTVSKDSRGRHLPHFPWGVHRLRRGELWLFSPYHRGAYDSRYFGPVRTAQVVSVLRPIWSHDSRARERWLAKLAE